MLLCFPENATITIKPHQEIVNFSYLIDNRLNFIALTYSLNFLTGYEAFRHSHQT